MLIGVPKEIKNNENRVGLTPAGAEALVKAGHKVLVEQGGGLGRGAVSAPHLQQSPGQNADHVVQEAVGGKVKAQLVSRLGDRDPEESADGGLLRLHRGEGPEIVGALQ